MRRVPEGPRPPPRDGPALSNDNLPDLMPSLKDYLNAKPVEYRKRGWAERISDGLHVSRGGACAEVRSFDSRHD